MTAYLKVQPFNFGSLDRYTANAIVWDITNYKRNAEEAEIICNLIFVYEDGSSRGFDTPDAELRTTIPSSVLNAWGADDQAIDDFVLSLSPLFQPT